MALQAATTAARASATSNPSPAADTAGGKTTNKPAPIMALMPTATDPTSPSRRSRGAVMSEVVVDDQGSVVGPPLGPAGRPVDDGVSGRCGKLGRRDLVIDAPAGVGVVGLTAHRPPRVGPVHVPGERA